MKHVTRVFEADQHHHLWSRKLEVIRLMGSAFEKNPGHRKQVPLPEVSGLNISVGQMTEDDLYVCKR